MAVLSFYLFVNKNNREPWSPGTGRNKTKSTPVRETVISDSRDGVSSNLVANLGGRDLNTLDDWNVSNSSNSGKGSWSSKGGSVGQDSAIQEDLGVSLPLLPLSNDGLISSSRGSKDGETIGQWMGGVSSIGEGMGGVGDGREGRRVVDERSGGRDHSAGSSQDGGLGISGPLAVVTITVTIGVTIVTSVASVTVSVVAIVSISISLWLSISRSLAIVAKAVVANSDRDGVSGHFMLNLGRSDNIRLHNWNMSNSANSGTNVGHPSSVG